jgi:hypothetical protein
MTTPDHRVPRLAMFLFLSLGWEPLTCYFRAAEANSLTCRIAIFLTTDP